MLDRFFHRHETVFIIGDSVDISTPNSVVKMEEIPIVPGEKRLAICLPFLGEIILYEKEVNPLKTRARKL